MVISVTRSISRATHQFSTVSFFNIAFFHGCHLSPVEHHVFDAMMKHVKHTLFSKRAFNRLILPYFLGLQDHSSFMEYGIFPWRYNNEYFPSGQNTWNDWISQTWIYSDHCRNSHEGCSRRQFPTSAFCAYCAPLQNCIGRCLSSDFVLQSLIYWPDFVRAKFR